MRTGEFRICPQCQTRNKSTQPRCVRCGRALFSIPLTASAPLPGFVSARGGARWTRGLIVAGVLIASAFGLFVRRTFRGASIEADTSAAVASAPDPGPGAPSISASAAPVAQAEPATAAEAYSYGEALWATGSRDRAIWQLERAARMDPQNTAYRVELGNALAALRRTREAIREYEAAVSLDPGNAENVTALATLYARAGDSAESRALLQRAAALNPGNAELQRRLAEADAGQAPLSYTPSVSSAPADSSAPSAPSAVSASSTGPTSGVVYTNDDLRRAGTGRTPGAVPPQPAPTVVRSATQQLGEDEGHWRDKAADRREAVRSAEQRVAALKAQLDQLHRHADGQASAGDDLEHEIAKTQDDLESSQERLAKAQRRMEELQDEARRKGLPPDWLR
jgi:tetratricopeptide (TPR) repeat protein